MFNLCYKNNKKDGAVTVYSDILRAIIFIVFMSMLPFGIFLAPYFSVLTKSVFFGVAAIALYSFFNEFWYALTQRIPLLVISSKGIRPILAKDGDLDPDAALITWDDIAEIFIYKAPFSYTLEHTAESGFRYIGIKLRNKNLTSRGQIDCPKIIPSVQIMIPYSNDKDIPLTMMHPFQRGLIKWLNYYREQYLKQRS